MSSTAVCTSVPWTDLDGSVRGSDWRSPAGHPVPGSIEAVGPDLRADEALRRMADGRALLWRADLKSARLLMQALQRRWQARSQRPGQQPVPADGAQAFEQHRRQQAARAEALGRLLLPLRADHLPDLPGHLPESPEAPERMAGALAFGPVERPYLMSLREWLGLVGAAEWRRLGVPVPALKAKVHPHLGVFAPVRGEYVDLVAQAPLPAVVHGAGAFDIGTGTGVLAAVLARRKVRVIATDNQPAAVACARENLARLGLDRRVQVIEADLYPPGHAGLIVCNPPWVPAEPFGPLDAAVYDPDSRMLRAFLAGLRAHLSRGGEGWLILSDLAERLGLRSREALAGWIAAAGLQVLDRLDTRPTHAKSQAPGDDPLARARRAEVTSLWRLGTA